MKKVRQIAICAGGTGGHIFPALSLASAIRESDGSCRITFFSSSKKVEAAIFSGKGYPRVKIVSAPFVRKIGLGPIKALLFLTIGIVQSFVKLVSIRPQLVISFGGYSSLAPVIAAFILRIPVIVHEQNSVPGMVNRISAIFAKKVMVGFSGTARAFGKKGVYTGNPVRKEVLQAREIAKRPGSGRKTLLIVGGSQGARSLNKAAQCLPEMVPDTDIIHVCGQADYIRISSEMRGVPGYRVFPFLDDIFRFMAKADLIVSRAGATTITEIAALGKPSVLVPFPYSSEDHQLMNSRIFESVGASIVIEHKDLNAKALADRLNGLLSDPETLAKMGADARQLYCENSIQLMMEVLDAVV